jgi:uncharacterized protein YbaR (Trm112 family)
MQQTGRIHEALDLIVCPACHGRLTLTGATVVDCTACGRRYPVVDGIPALLMDPVARQR